ncbi:FecR family protein [Chitinophaga lutea]
MDKRTFEELVGKYLAGEATEAEKALLDQWYDQFHDDPAFPLDDAAAARMESELYSRIRTGRSRVRILPVLRIAALWVLVAGAGVLAYTQRKAIFSVFNREKAATLATARGEIKKIRLPDGTEVWLNSGSTLQYPESFEGDVREVTLEGEAFFDVQQAPARPFVVRSGPVKTEVLGTSFNVRSYAALGEVKVAVSTGKVMVSGHERQVTVTPNRQAVYHRSDSLLQTEEIDAAAAAGWIKGDYAFRDATLAEIAVALENRFGVSIRITGAKLPSKRMTAGFSAEDSLASVLENLRETAGLYYKFDRPDAVVLYE